MPLADVLVRSASVREVREQLPTFCVATGGVIGRGSTIVLAARAVIIRCIGGHSDCS